MVSPNLLSLSLRPSGFTQQPYTERADASISGGLLFCYLASGTLYREDQLKERPIWWLCTAMPSASTGKAPSLAPGLRHVIAAPALLLCRCGRRGGGAGVRAEAHLNGDVSTRLFRWAIELKNALLYFYLNKSTLLQDVAWSGSEAESGVAQAVPCKCTDSATEASKNLDVLLLLVNWEVNIAVNKRYQKIRKKL